jgi:DNA-binding response OmpR family regulator
VIADIVMPGMSGREMARLIRTERPTTRVLFTSGYTEDTVAPGGVLDAGVALLEKPFTANELLRRVREMLDHEGPGGPETDTHGGTS